jgi:hypothetical protein
VSLNQEHEKGDVVAGGEHCEAGTDPKSSILPYSDAANDLNLADTEIESNWDTVTDNFDNMELKPELLRGIYAYG